MHIALWIAQILLSFIFVLIGSMLLGTPKNEIDQKVSWAKNFSAPFTKFFGSIEVLGAIGLIFPMRTGILPWLTALAAFGLGLNMVGAIVTHLKYREYPNIIFPFILLLLAISGAYGRSFIVPDRYRSEYLVSFSVQGFSRCDRVIYKNGIDLKLLEM